ncbi:hypothetical protein HKL94_00120 [Candidatus Parcubacteria bacterium]|nr:hypothetical protein [Candidatus Parcubacteria bacterium]
MKNLPFEELIKKAGKEIRLSTDERAHMLSVLREHIASNPIKNPAPRFTAYQVMIGTVLAYARRPAFAFAAAVLILAVFGGATAYAAEGSLPGDPLYAVKVDVMEPLQTALTFSTAGKIAWQQTLAERRLDEAMMLASKGRLGTTTEAMLASNFIEHANAAAHISFAASSPSITLAPLYFAAQLSAYQNVLAAQAKSDHGRNTTAILQSAVRTEISLLGSTEGSQIQSATDLQGAAQAALEGSARFLGSVTGTLSTSSSKNAQGAFDRAQALTTHGNALLRQNDTTGASQAFRSSLTATAQLNVLTHAAATLHIDAFNSSSTSSTSTQSTSTMESNGSSDVYSSETATSTSTTTTPAPTSDSTNSTTLTAPITPAPIPSISLPIKL